HEVNELSWDATVQTLERMESAHAMCRDPLAGNGIKNEGATPTQPQWRASKPDSKLENGQKHNQKGGQLPGLD
ncbi:MAG: hypothetical protein AAFY01_13750, partial [Pseudomonadota bacterium]